MKCRYCQTDFGTANPLSLGDMHRREKRKETQKGLLNTVVALFAISLVDRLRGPSYGYYQLRGFAAQATPDRRRQPGPPGVGLFRDRHHRGILDLMLILCIQGSALTDGRHVG